MLSKIAIKRLKSSDLSFFKSYLDRHPGSKQKGFNLDVSILEGKFFPGLKALLEPRPKRAVHVDLVIHGPGGAGAHVLARKVKIDAKNLRLNGEYVHDPVGQIGRYATVAPDDFAVMQFVGEEVPTGVNVVLVSGNSSEADRRLYESLAILLPVAGSMRVVTAAQLDEAASRAGLQGSHPILQWIDPRVMEGVGADDGLAIELINRKRSRRGLSAAMLAEARETAARIGRNGEELVNVWLTEGGCPEVVKHVWESDANAISPFDFSVVDATGIERRVEVKSTGGDFSAPIHMSIGEVRCAAEEGVSYDIYRVHALDEDGGRLRVARAVGHRLKGVLNAFAALPVGVRVDKMTFDPDFFGFDPEDFSIQFPKD